MTLLVLALLAATPCAQCHEAQAARFASSRHAQARRLPIFDLPFRNARTRWCLECHLPEGKGDGLTCESCHAVAGRTGAVRATVATGNGGYEHDVVVDRAMTTQVCARCHQFNLPLHGHREPIVLSEQPLQSTVFELETHSPSATCVDCHDPHLARGSHDRATLAKALLVTARRQGERLQLELQVGDTGHRFPTGDPFRRLVLESCADAACTESLASRVLYRRIGTLPDGTFAQLADTTLASGDRHVVSLPYGRFWRVRYFYGDPQFEARLPSDEVSVTLAQGETP